MTYPSSSPQTLLEAGSPAAPTRWLVIGLAFAAVLLDGYDTASLGLAVPGLSKAWELPPAAFTLPLMATNLGVVIGYITCGKVSVLLGLRRTLLIGVAVCAIGSALTAVSPTIPLMTASRIITGIGLGAVLPSAISLATANRPGKSKEVIAVLVSMGLSAGSLAAGLSGGLLISGFGWSSVFWVGAVLPALLLPLMWVAIGNPPAAQSNPQVRRENVGSLFRDGFTTRTLLLWAFAFLIFTTFYAFSSWLPTLLTGFGFSTAMAPLGAASLGVGGIVGALLLVAFSSRFRTSYLLMAASSLAIVFLLLVSVLQPGQWQLLFIFAGVGMGLATGMVGQAAVAVSTYPETSRTTGVGWAAAMGRVGSVAGPAFGGALLAAGQSPQSVVLVACLPVLVGLLVMGVLARKLGPSKQIDSAPGRS